MAQVSTYLNFPRSTEAAFNFYKSIFKTEFSTPIGRFKDIPAQRGLTRLSRDDLEAADRRGEFGFENRFIKVERRFS